MERFGITTEEMNDELFNEVVSFIESRKGDYMDAEYSFDLERYVGGYDHKSLLESVLSTFNLGGELYTEICEHLVWELTQA